MKFLSSLLTRRHPHLASAEALVKEVNGFESEMHARTKEELANVTIELRAELARGVPLDKLAPRAFAAVREASLRTLGERHYDVQLVGGYILHKGAIAEMRTGEGKTLVATLPAYLNALVGKGVHVVTVNDYLARRDGVWMGQIYHALGMRVSVLNDRQQYQYDPSAVQKNEEAALDADVDAHGSFKVVHEFLRPITRVEAYQADVTYGTNNEFGFDYLRDNLEYVSTDVRQKHHHFAVVDEVDSILIDEARTPLIISGESRNPEELYHTCAAVARTMKAGEHFTVDEKARAVLLTSEGIAYAERALGVENLYVEGGAKLAHHLETAVKASALYQKDKEYVVRDGEIIIVDEFTGRMQPGRRWSEGLHQAIEAKEGVAVKRESQTYASITFQNYFRMYEKVAGMTGTGMTSQEEFLSVYNLDVVAVPTHRTVQRIDQPDKIFQSENGKFSAIAKEVATRHAKGQPVLIGTTSIEMNERLADSLRSVGIPHEVLNAKNHEREGEIIAAAGHAGAVTVATNMAGRGVDIKLGGPDATPEEREKVRTLGGLFVVGTERHDARRIDNQLRGRAGRQGDPGETQFFVSMEDKLMRIFASDTVRSLLGTLGIPEDEPIQSRVVTRALESAQEKIEGVNFDARKHILGFDDVLNHQRSVVYARRRDVLMGDSELVLTRAREHLTSVGVDPDEITRLTDAAGVEATAALVRRILLQAYDLFWIEHLETMEHLRGSVNLRAYGGRDPFIEYKREGLRLFRNLEAHLSQYVGDAIKRVSTEPQKVAAPAPLPSISASGRTHERNERVKITNGIETKEMKFKKAEELLASGWRIVE